MNSNSTTEGSEQPKESRQEEVKPYEYVELTPEEIEAAILEGKKRKYFHEKSKDYWASLESKQGTTKVIEYAETRKKLS